jgi:peptidyl-prolyl cis-trans isomerase SurA
VTPAHVLDELISRALIQQQIRQEDEQAAVPSQAEVDARLMNIRKELPACVQQNCATEAGWKEFLAAHSLEPARVEAYLRNRIEVLRFIEGRFRQGIQVTPEEIEAYYKTTLVPRYSAGTEAPALNTVSSRIEEILLEQRVNVLFEDWLKNLRNQGEIEVLDPALETPGSQTGPGEGSR